MPSRVDAVVNLGAEIPGYELLARLGGGGMGEVYLARRTGVLGFEKLVALKTVLPKYKKRSTVEVMFLDEARTAARLNHPAVPQVYDFGEAGRTFYLAMEYVAGVSFDVISEMLAGPWPAVVAARAMAHTCRGLHSAHILDDLSGRPLNIVHRDVSPHNLLLSFDGRVKLIDFGIAITRGRLVHTTQRNEVRGKVRYMSPEQLQRKKLDFRADIFASGVVLYELLVGPGATKDLPLMGEAALDDCLEPLSSKNPEVPEALNDIVMHALRAEPRERFATAKEMARALEALAVGPEADLEDFASDVLGSAREEHQVWLRDLIDEEESGDDLARRSTVPLPALPGRVSTSLHRLVDDDPDDTTEHRRLAEPDSGETTPRLRRSLPATPVREPVADVSAADVEPSAPVHQSLVLLGGGAGIALVVGLLLFTVFRSTEPPTPSTRSPHPSEVEPSPPPSMSQAQPIPPTSKAQQSPSPSMSKTQRQIYNLRLNVAAMIAAKGLIEGDDERVDQALLILDAAALEESLERAHIATSLANQALARVKLDEPFLTRKLSRLKRQYDDVDDPAALRRLNPMMSAIIQARLSEDWAEMNQLMNRAFGVMNEP